MKHILIASVFLMALTACKTSIVKNPDIDPWSIKNEKPQVVHVGFIQPDLIGVTIKEQYLVQGNLIRYIEEEGDSIQLTYDSHGILSSRKLYRDGELTGYIAGNHNDSLHIFESVGGDTLINEGQLQSVDSYLITSEQDANCISGIMPEKVYQKSKIHTWAEPNKQLVMLHTVYLKLPIKLTNKSQYQLTMKDFNLDKENIEFIFDPKVTRSEAIHVSQVGFKPDDPLKTAFVSLWEGTGESMTFGEINFEIIDVQTGETLFEGKGDKVLEAEGTERLQPKKNFAMTEVWQLDFSTLSKPGEYQVYVENMGVSFPFEVNSNSYNKALNITMLGFLHHRSGIALDKPLTDYFRPRPMHPDDGVNVYKSDFSIMDNYIYYGGGQDNVFKGLVENKTDETVDYAWGGYMDAGDWDRRSLHLWATHQLLELYEMFPSYYQKVAFQIPDNELNNHIPDLLDEAMFNIDCYRRMQQPNGGIPHGIESAAHPVYGEPSWLESLDIFMFKEDAFSSYQYISTAAKISRLLEDVDSTLSEIYRVSSLDAMNYAEQEWSRLQTIKEFREFTGWRRQTVEDQRCLAAIELYALTGEKKYEEIFREQSILLSDSDDDLLTAGVLQIDAAFMYCNLPDELIDSELKQKAIEFVLLRANDDMNIQLANAFGLTDRNSPPEVMNGFYSAVNNQELCRAHFLTGEEKYLKAAILSVQYTAGANPMNHTYTVGLGARSVQRPLHIDGRNTGQQMPVGTTVYGQSDPRYYADEWGLEGADLGSGYVTWAQYWFGRFHIPHALDWPVHEGYFDYSGYPSMNEYTIMQTFGPVSYAYGYLAAK